MNEFIYFFFLFMNHSKQSDKSMPSFVALLLFFLLSFFFLSIILSQGPRLYKPEQPKQGKKHFLKSCSRYLRISHDILDQM